VADEIPEAAVEAAAIAWTNRVPDTSSSDRWAALTETGRRMRRWSMRITLAAALPHLAAAKDAEITRLRAENEQLTRLCAEVSRLRWLVDEDGPVMHALGQIESMTARLEGVTDRSRLLDFAEVEQVYRLAGDAVTAIRTPSAPAQEGQTT